MDISGVLALLRNAKVRLALLVLLFFPLVLPSSAWPLDFRFISIARTLLFMGKYRSRQEAAATQGSFNRDPRFIKEGDKSIKISFNADINRVGAIGFEIVPIRADQGLSFWVYAEGCGADVKFRLWQNAKAFWESDGLSLDFWGWKEFRFRPATMTFRTNSQESRDWSKVRHIQIVLEGRSCTVYGDELRFFQDSH